MRELTYPSDVTDAEWGVLGAVRNPDGTLGPERTTSATTARRHTKPAASPYAIAWRHVRHPPAVGTVWEGVSRVTRPRLRRGMEAESR
jgi:hypothetical protein